MVTQYPHSIKIFPLRQLVRDGLDWIPDETEQVPFESECRAEPNISRANYEAPDGKIVTPIYTVYLPQTDYVAEYGSVVELTMETGDVVKTKVFRWHNGQMNTRLWL